MKYKYLIVGAGLSGLTIANKIASELNEEVLIIEKRSHIGGNVYDSYNKDGILIQNYGPHIFHTNEKEVYDYLSQFTEWIPYEHKVLSSVDNKLVPMPICIDTINELYNLNLDEEGMRNWIENEKVDIKEIKTSEDVVLANAGEDIYNKLFKNYTEKQWGTSAKNLDSSVISRIPFRFNHDTMYFEDTYQGIPKKGFTAMCDEMVKSDKIKIVLNTDYKEIIDEIEYETLIYTGPIDYFYDYKYGELLYRTLRFVSETYNKESYQSVAVVNYPNDYNFTRITEFKKLTQQKSDKTTIMKEYPGFNGEPCYPYPTKEYLDKFQEYKKDMDKENNIIFLGRLAEYKYYNMDLIVKSALDAFENKIKSD
ncbi:UDP-galactopyranose mutase [Methanobrevibacter sp. OttesenSCG-928-I08]|nr:UDP-galactopyranose mutase [Methanobrevibacter sp. OttesenSCG-928-I08]